MDKRYLWGLPILAVGIWMVYDRQGVPELSLDARATGTSYDPYAHWYHQAPGGWIRHYPQRVGPNCLGTVLTNEEGSLSTTQVDECAIEGGVSGYARGA